LIIMIYIHIYPAYQSLSLLNGGIYHRGWVGGQSGDGRLKRGQENTGAREEGE
jgi:hypothetical protein